MDKVTKPNPVTAALFGLRPPGFQIEARHNDSQFWTEYRFTREVDGLLCQEVVSDDAAYSAREPQILAEHVLGHVLAAFTATDQGWSP